MIRTCTATAAVLGLLALAPTASAAPAWVDGTIEESTVTNCNFYPETGIAANAQANIDANDVPEVGEPFYVRTIPARVGNGCGIPMHAHPELVLPPGVTTAITADRPVRCMNWDYMADTSSDASGCPQTPQQGIYGLAFDQETSNGPEPWEVVYGEGVVIEVPVVATRALKGTTPTCGRREGQPPCTPARSGDTIQWASWISDGRLDPWLTPYVPIEVKAAPTSNGAASNGAQAPAGEQASNSGGSGPAATPGQLTTNAVAPTIRTASTVTLRSLSRGLVVTLDVPTAGSSVQLKLSVKPKKKTVVLAKQTTRVTEAGKTQVKLAVPKSRLKSLGRMRKPLGAQLQAVVTAPDGSKTTVKQALKVKR